MWENVQVVYVARFKFSYVVVPYLARMTEKRDWFPVVFVRERVIIDDVMNKLFERNIVTFRWQRGVVAPVFLFNWTSDGLSVECVVPLQLFSIRRQYSHQWVSGYHEFKISLQSSFLFRLAVGREVAKIIFAEACLFMNKHLLVGHVASVLQPKTFKERASCLWRGAEENAVLVVAKDVSVPVRHTGQCVVVLSAQRPTRVLYIGHADCIGTNGAKRAWKTMQIMFSAEL